MIPGATPMSTLFEMTACCVSPPPCVYRISRLSPCFLKIPPRWPISAIDVSQLPRWPAATLSVSSARAGSAVANATAARVTQRWLNMLIDSSSNYSSIPSIVLLTSGCRRIIRPAISGSGRRLRLLRLVRCAQVRPFGVFRHDALERSEHHLRDPLGRGSNRGATVAHLARGVDHDAPELHDGHIACAESLTRPVSNRPHRFPHRDVLVGNSLDARMAAALHRLAVLKIIVGARPDATEARVEIDTDLRLAESAPLVLVDAFAFAPGDEVEHRVDIVERDVEDRQIVAVVRRNQHGERRNEERDAQIVVGAAILDRPANRHVAKAEVGPLHLQPRRLRARRTPQSN